MTQIKNVSIESAMKAGLSAKAAKVYIALLEAGTPISPKNIILRTSLHRQYVYVALKELEDRRLLTHTGEKKKIKYGAGTPDRLIQDAEKNRLSVLDGVKDLMKLYDTSPAGIVEVIRGSQNVIEDELSQLRLSSNGDFLDVVGGAGMNWVNLFEGRIEEWEKLRKEKNIKLRYIGSGDDVEHNRTKSIIHNESKKIPGIGNIVNVSIRPESVSFNIYQPEILTVRVKNPDAVKSQRALFEVLWNLAK